MQPTPYPSDDDAERAADLEAFVDAVIALCEGDSRAAIRSLVVANEFLEADNERLRGFASVGYVRLGLGNSAMDRIWRGC